MAQPMFYIAFIVLVVFAASVDDLASLQALNALKGYGEAVSPHIQDPTMIQKDIERLRDAEAQLRMATERLTRTANSQPEIISPSALLSSQPTVSTDSSLGNQGLSPSKLDAQSAKSWDGLEHPAKVGFSLALDLVDEELCSPTCRVGNGVCARRSGSQSSHFSCVCRHPFVGPSCAERQTVIAEPAALYQSSAQTERMRNPALALLLEPLLYGYSLLSCTCFVILAGVFSAIYMHVSKCPQEHEVAWRLHRTGGAFGRLKSYFKYPSALLVDGGIAPTSATPLAAAVESENAEVAVSSYFTRRRLEVWRPAPPCKADLIATGKVWEGYVDDESDCDMEKCCRQPPGRYQPSGYVDER
mmetsp:Transcript_18202/g.28688  ORF Transcript_18202/g.28688 Transcript_18202/m.28688 type:complete len:358 (-) Transcript_18202:30-1103(-)